MVRKHARGRSRRGHGAVHRRDDAVAWGRGCQLTTFRGRLQLFCPDLTPRTRAGLPVELAASLLAAAAAFVRTRTGVPVPSPAGLIVWIDLTLYASSNINTADAATGPAQRRQAAAGASGAAAGAAGAMMEEGQASSTGGAAAPNTGAHPPPAPVFGFSRCVQLRLASAAVCVALCLRMGILHTGATPS